MHRIILADDHAMLRSGMKAMLESSGEFAVIGEAADGVELLELLNRGIVPDTLILDLTMPRMSGIEALENIQRMGLNLKVLVLTMHNDLDMFCHSFWAGATGYMLKEGIAKELLNGVRSVTEGKIYCSPGMITEVPDTCAIKSNEGRVRPDGLIHCRA